MGRPCDGRATAKERLAVFRTLPARAGISVRNDPLERPPPRARSATFSDLSRGRRETSESQLRQQHREPGQVINAQVRLAGIRLL